MKEQSYTIGGESMSGTGPDQVEKALCTAGKAEQRDISLRFLGGVVEQGSGHWRATLLENRHDFENEEERGS